jgi:hypothetical protein
MGLPAQVDVTRLLWAGDVHASRSWFRFLTDTAVRADCQVIMQVGDFGFWPRQAYGRRFLADVDAALAAVDVWLCFVDGNHEDHEELDLLPTDPYSGFRRAGERIFYLPRGVRWEWCGTTFAAAGGAVSADRADLTAGVDWFAQETLSTGEAYTIAAGGHADVVVAHDCPAGVDLGLTQLRDPAPQAHREMLAEVATAVTPYHWFHGHYHRPHTSTLWLPDGAGRRPVTVHGLDRDHSGPGAYAVHDTALLAEPAVTVA